MCRIQQGCAKPYRDGLFPGPWPRKTIMGGVYRLEGLLLKGPSSVGDVVGVHPTFPHQHLGNDGNFPGFEAPSCPCGYPCVDPDEQATALDAFSVDWNKWDSIYLFPPASMILKVLNFLESNKGHAVLLIRYWPNQLWY